MLAMLDVTPGLVMVSSRDGKLLYMNDTGRQVMGFGRHESLNHSMVHDLYSPASRERLVNEAVPTCLGGDVWRGEMVFVDRHRNEVPMSQFLMAHRVEEAGGGTATVLSGIAWDIRNLKQVEHTLRHQATHDPLTGLANRVLFKERLDHAIRMSELDRTFVAVMFLDLDDFKLINDTRGHDVGDAVLCEIAQRLKSRVRAQDMIARYGGDEFLLLVAGLAVPADVARVVQQIREIVREPCLVGGEPISVTASIGLAMHPFDGLDATSLLRRADRVMYQQKREMKIAS